MGQRITEKDLQSCCDTLNDLFGYAAGCYTKKPEGGYKPNQNVYHIDHAYGGVSLVQMSSREGCTGVSDVHGVYGRYTKRELYERMNAYIAGINDHKEAMK